MFDHWEIDLSGTDSSTSLLMNEDKTVRAVFKELFTLTMAKAPAGAGGSVSPSPGEHLYKDGDEATLSASDGSTWLFANWSGDLGGNTTPVTVTMDEDKTITGNFVTIEKIQYNDGTEYVDVPDPLYVLKGDSVSFKAIPNPEGATWPQSKPAWGGTSGATGTGSTKSVTFNTASSSSSDYKTVTAECGATRSVNVLVVDCELVSIDFTSDHDVMWDENNCFADVGGSYTTPVWTSAGRNNPISQTRDTFLEANVRVRVGIPDMEFRLEGTGGTGYWTFSGTAVSTGAEQDVHVVAEYALPDFLAWRIATIGWQVVLLSDGHVVPLGSSGPHEAFVTFGAPNPPTTQRPTLYRNRFIFGFVNGFIDVNDVLVKIGEAIRSRTVFGGWPAGYSDWQTLDLNKAIQIDCNGTANLAYKFAEIIGWPDDSVAIVTAFPSTDPGDGYNYPSHCGFYELKPDSPLEGTKLYYTLGGAEMYPAENGFKMTWPGADTWGYATVYPDTGPFYGGGFSAGVRELQCLYAIMDYQHDFWAFYGQFWDKNTAYPAPDLPQG